MTETTTVAAEAVAPKPKRTSKKKATAAPAVETQAVAVVEAPQVEENGMTDLQAKEAELRTQGLDYEVFEYRHGFFDLTYIDDEDTKVRLEYRPNGSEILRNERGDEVK